MIFHNKEMLDKNVLVAKGRCYLSALHCQTLQYVTKNTTTKRNTELHKNSGLLVDRHNPA